MGEPEVSGAAGSPPGAGAPPTGAAPSAAGPLPRDAPGLAAAVRAGDRRALARAITLVENGEALGADVVREVYGATGRAGLVGVTGAPGVGKSSLVGALVRHLRTDATTTVGVVSVDPSSPFTQGALLGDRIRLADHFLDPGVFIRSMGTRGHLGGVAEATLQALLLLDAAGRTELLLETVGVGQSEVQVARLADTVVLVLMPGSGDSVQALKAGIMEVPDVVVVNKADHPKARELHQHVRAVLQLTPDRAWMPPIVETTATDGTGVDRLWDAVLAHRSFLAQDGRGAARRQASLDAELFGLAAGRAAAELRRRVTGDPRLRALLDDVHARRLDPLGAVELLLAEVFRP